MTLAGGFFQGGDSMPGAKYASLKNPRQYEALRRKGLSKAAAARISNSKARKRRLKTRRRKNRSR